MTVRLAYLVSPEPGKYELMIQPFGADEPFRFEIEDFHLANIVADGAHYLLRKSVLSVEPIMKRGSK
jgi:hypothetical protein